MSRNTPSKVLMWVRAGMTTSEKHVVKPVSRASIRACGSSSFSTSVSVSVIILGSLSCASGKILRYMNREYHKAYSQELHRDMEVLVFGHGGTPLLVFPTSMGRFFEYEDRGMIGVLSGKLEGGELQLFCPDSVDTESWYNKGAHPYHRVQRHLQYERYVVNELLPFIRWKNPAQLLAVTGCSFGGYHAVNFALKHPDAVSHCVAMSGAYDIHQFLDG